MKASEVLRILNITRTTLYRYVKNSKIKVTKKLNGYYDYDAESVFTFLGKSNNIRKNIIYARVSTQKQKNDLINQIQYIKKYCKNNNILINEILYDIHSGLDLDRKKFNLLLDDIFHYKINFIIISYKDRLTRLSFSVFEKIFKQFGTKIIVINNNYTDNEPFNDIITLMHSITTKIYSKRNYKK